MAQKTEWDLQMEKFGIIPPEIKEEDLINMVEETIENKTKEKEMEDMTLEELDDKEDDLLMDDESESILLRLRETRLAELRERAAREKFGSVLEVSKADWTAQITEVRDDTLIVVLIYEKCQIMSNLAREVLRKFAAKHRDVKCLSGEALVCIPDYPSRNIPTILVYKNGATQFQLVGPSSLADQKFCAEYLEWKLAEKELIQSSIKKNPLQKKDVQVSSTGVLIGSRHGNAASDEDENDSD